MNGVSIPARAGARHTTSGDRYRPRKARMRYMKSHHTAP